MGTKHHLDIEKTGKRRALFGDFLKEQGMWS